MFRPFVCFILALSLTASSSGWAQSAAAGALPSPALTDIPADPVDSQAGNKPGVIRRTQKAVTHTLWEMFTTMVFIMVVTFAVSIYDRVKGGNHKSPDEEKAIFEGAWDDAVGIWSDTELWAGNAGFSVTNRMIAGLMINLRAWAANETIRPFLKRLMVEGMHSIITFPAWDGIAELVDEARHRHPEHYELTGDLYKVITMLLRGDQAERTKARAAMGALFSSMYEISLADPTLRNHWIYNTGRLRFQRTDFILLTTTMAAVSALATPLLVSAGVSGILLTAPGFAAAFFISALVPQSWKNQGDEYIRNGRIWVDKGRLRTLQHELIIFDRDVLQRNKIHQTTADYVRADIPDIQILPSDDPKTVAEKEKKIKALNDVKNYYTDRIDQKYASNLLRQQGVREDVINAYAEMMYPQITDLGALEEATQNITQELRKRDPQFQLTPENVSAKRADYKERADRLSQLVSIEKGFYERAEMAKFLGPFRSKLLAPLDILQGKSRELDILDESMPQRSFINSKLAQYRQGAIDFYQEQIQALTKVVNDFRDPTRRGLVQAEIKRMQDVATPLPRLLLPEVLMDREFCVITKMFKESFSEKNMQTYLNCQ